MLPKKHVICKIQFERENVNTMNFSPSTTTSYQPKNCKLFQSAITHQNVKKIHYPSLGVKKYEQCYVNEASLYIFVQTMITIYKR